MITGLGPITSIGSGVEAFWQAVLDGRSGGRKVDFEWASDRKYRSMVGAPVTEEPSLGAAGLTAREADLLDPASRYAIASSGLALRDAGFDVRADRGVDGAHDVAGVDPNRLGVIIGTGIGGLTTLERSHRAWVTRQPFVGWLRYSLPMLIPNALPAQVAIHFGAHGETKAVATACAAGTMALGDAWRLIRDDELDVAVTGGVEKTLGDYDGFGLLGFDVLKTLSTRNDDPARASRPFDADRDGFVLSEGAGVLVLEAEEHARARGARIYARVMGYATTCDAHSMMQIEPSGEQMVRVMEKAIVAAGLAPGDIGYVNAHGTSTRQNDAQEAKAIRRVFGRRHRDVLVNSTKAMTGHGIAASGGIEAITTALSLARGLVHRCVNLERPDPDCDLSLPRDHHASRPRAALSNSFGFGGHNATLVLGEV